MDTFLDQWSRAADHLRGDRPVTGDAGHLYRISHCLILAHEDKVFDGATIASLSTPWGEVMGDDDLGGYHLVWTRDMCNSATGLLAAGHNSPPLRALIYLACSQCPDGGFFQNFWLGGDPYWRGIQLDEVSFPIMLAWRLHECGGLDGFDPWPLVRNAAGYVIEHGPATAQERWEENSGYSPSTLAANIAGLVCAASFARSARTKSRPCFLEEYADFLESHVDRWTVTTEGELVPGIPRHFIRINPVTPGDLHADENPNHNRLELRNRPPARRHVFPAKNIVDAGFLELVRYGIRPAGDALVRGFAARDRCRFESRHTLWSLLAPLQPRWLRSALGWRTIPGLGARARMAPADRRARALRIGGRPRSGPYIHAMEQFATSTALLPEQVWDQPDNPEARCISAARQGRPCRWSGRMASISSSYGRRPMVKVFDRLAPGGETLSVGRQAAPPRDLEIQSSDSLNAGRHAAAPGGAGAVQTTLVGGRMAALRGYRFDSHRHGPSICRH